MRYLAGALDPARTDGARYAAYVDDEALDTVVIDTRTGATRRYETPRGSCGELLTRIVDVAPGRLTWAGCPGDEELASLDLASGERQGPSGPQTPHFGEGRWLIGIGSEWLRFRYTDYHILGMAYVSRQNGQRVDEFSFPGRANQVPDLDAAGLYARLCSPLRRRATVNDDPYENQPRWIPYEYRPPYGLTTDRRDLAGTLHLDRCGSARSARLERCSGSCGSVQLGRRAAVWTIGGDVGAYLLTKRRLARRRVARQRYRYDNPLVAATTDRTVFVSRRSGRAWRVSTMPLRTLLATGSGR